MPTKNDKPTVRTNATTLQHVNGSAPANNGCFPICDGLEARDPETGSEIFSETWAPRHNHELWGTGPDGTRGWRDQADGFFR
jgi:hypothetical protein